MQVAVEVGGGWLRLVEVGGGGLGEWRLQNVCMMLQGLGGHADPIGEVGGALVAAGAPSFPTPPSWSTCVGHQRQPTGTTHQRHRRSCCRPGGSGRGHHLLPSPCTMTSQASHSRVRSPRSWLAAGSSNRMLLHWSCAVNRGQCTPHGWRAPAYSSAYANSAQ